MVPFQAQSSVFPKLTTSGLDGKVVEWDLLKCPVQPKLLGL